MNARFLLSPVLLIGLLVGCGGPVETSEQAVESAKPADQTIETKQAPSPWLMMQPKWGASVTPYRIIGNIHFVGTEGLAMFFIPTDAGHIVIDGGLPEHGQMIADNITALGYDPSDVKILLNTHAHFDHSGGLASLKQITGAQLLASEGDRSALEGGFYLGSEDQEIMNAPPVQVDKIIEDGEVVSLGGTHLTAHLTPGHTRGCTSWTLDVEKDGTTYQALIFCSATVAANRLVGPPQYAGIIADYRITFEKTKDWKPDIFLANHPEFFRMAKKQKVGTVDAFIDPGEFPKFIARMGKKFDDELTRQTGLIAEE
jgi:metallo-beta-lactamase class B